MRPAVDANETGGILIPVRWSQAPSSIGLGKSAGNGKSVGFDISLPVDQEGLVEELIAADPRSLSGDTPPIGHNCRKVGRRLLEQEGSCSIEQRAAKLCLTVLS